jgi:hypothetical protein
MKHKKPVRRSRFHPVSALLLAESYLRCGQGAEAVSLLLRSAKRSQLARPWQRKIRQGTMQLRRSLSFQRTALARAMEHRRADALASLESARAAIKSARATGSALPNDPQPGVHDNWARVLDAARELYLNVNGRVRSALAARRE